MKIQCDVCNKDQASVFCSADEAALCAACDHRVHHANKLAGKHQRFSLLQPSPKQFPLCDICQEKRAFLFCQQDRALLCKDCDLPIHKANEHTKNHNRFLLTGVKLSASSAVYTAASPEATVTDNTCDVVPSFNKSQNSINKPLSVTNQPSTPKIATLSSEKNINPQMMVVNGGSNGSTSSISEYLMEMLPGWHVEDFLDSSSLSNAFYTKIGENDGLDFWDDDLEGNLSSFSSENNMGIWVPQVPPPVTSHQSNTSSSLGFGGQICFKDPKEATINTKSSRKWRDDGGFTVPQISPSFTATKRSRTFW